MRTFPNTAIQDCAVLGALLVSGAELHILMQLSHPSTVDCFVRRALYVLLPTDVRILGRRAPRRMYMHIHRKRIGVNGIALAQELDQAPPDHHK